MKRNFSLWKCLGILAAPLLAISPAAILFSCQDETPTVGSALASGEVQIALDSLIWNGTDQILRRGESQTSVYCPKISYSTDFDNAVDTRSTTNLLGRISVPEYGDLNCSFVSRLMCANSLAIPDSIREERIDSMKLFLTVPRGALTGDSLAPQQLKVFRLTKSLPSDITNSFDPTGYYDPDAPLGTRSFTLSALGMSDSLYTKLSSIDIEIPMSRNMALEVVEAYRNDDTKSIFAWPQTFEKYFHGIYVEPSFGRGCVANITSTNFVIFYSYRTQSTSTGSDGTVTTSVKNNVGTVGIFGSSPITLSSNNVTYKPSDYLKNRAADGQALVTTPGGYRVSLRFPARELIDIYQTSQSKLAVISDLTFSIPVEEIENDYGLTPPPYLLMVKSSRLKEFLANNSLPDKKDSFTAEYSASTKRYVFDSMRQYILDLIRDGVKDEDLDFTIIPVDLVYEENQQNTSIWGWYSSSSSSTPVLTKCTPYITKPSMCRLRMDEARTIFSFSLQQMK